MTTRTRVAGGAQQLLAGLLLRVAGAGLLIASAGVHLDLYATGYRTIPAIGWLFLLQVITGFVIGLMVLATGRRLLAAAGALFALSTLGGYLLSVQVGLFGFVRYAPRLASRPGSWRCWRSRRWRCWRSRSVRRSGAFGSDTSGTARRSRRRRRRGTGEPAR